MVALVVNVVALVALLAVSAVRPGFGIGLALALGRHTFPDRETPLLPAAPLFVAAAVLALSLGRRRFGGDWRHLFAVQLTVLVVAVGAFRESAAIDVEIGLLADDKAMFLLVALVPLLLLTPALRYEDVRADVVRVLLAVPLMLTMLSLALGSTSNAGRASALGGGPITLATAAGMGVLILLHYNGSLLTSRLSAFEKPARLAAGVILVIGMILSESRQPILSLLIVVAATTLTSTNKLILSESNERSVQRAKRVRFLSLIVLGGSAIGLTQLVLANPDGRLALLAANPSGEIQRSRLPTWQAGIEEISTGGIWGHGFGSFIRSAGALDYAHNLGIELLSEVGPLVGMVVLVALAFAGFAAVRGGNRLFGILAFFAWLGTNFSGDLYNSRYFFFFLLTSLTIGLQGKVAEQLADSSDLSRERIPNVRVAEPTGAST